MYYVASSKAKNEVLPESHGLIWQQWIPFHWSQLDTRTWDNYGYTANVYVTEQRDCIEHRVTNMTVGRELLNKQENSGSRLAPRLFWRRRVTPRLSVFRRPTNRVSSGFVRCNLLAVHRCLTDGDGVEWLDELLQSAARYRQPWTGTQTNSATQSSGKFFDLQLFMSNIAMLSYRNVQ